MLHVTQPETSPKPHHLPWRLHQLFCAFNCSLSVTATFASQWKWARQTQGPPVSCRWVRVWASGINTARTLPRSVWGTLQLSVKFSLFAKKKHSWNVCLRDLLLLSFLPASPARIPPGGSRWYSGKASACSAGGPGLIPGLGSSLGPGTGNSLHGQRSLEGYSPRGRKESDTTKRLSTAQIL